MFMFSLWWQLSLFTEQCLQLAKYSPGWNMFTMCGPLLSCTEHSISTTTLGGVLEQHYPGRTARYNSRYILGGVWEQPYLPFCQIQIPSLTLWFVCNNNYLMSIVILRCVTVDTNISPTGPYSRSPAYPWRLD